MGAYSAKNLLRQGVDVLITRKGATQISARGVEIFGSALSSRNSSQTANRVPNSPVQFLQYTDVQN